MTDMRPGVLLADVATVNPRRPKLDVGGTALTSFVPMHAVDETTGSVRDQPARPFSEVGSGYSYFEQGDVLFAKVSPCMQNGKHALIERTIGGFGFGSTEFHVVRPGPALHSRWLLHFLRRAEVIDSAAKTFTGSVGLQRVPDTYLRTLQFDLPTLADQERAVRQLDAALAQARLCTFAIDIALTDAMKLPTAHLKAVFGQVPPIAVAKADGAAPGWRWAQLTDLARLESGHTPSRRRPEWWGGDVPWLALPDIRKLHGLRAHHTVENTNDAGLANSSARLLPVNTVCLCRDASIGFVTILGRPMATSQHFANWVCDATRLDPGYLMYAVMASHDYLRELGSGSVLKTIYMPTIQSFHVLAPDITEQRRIAGLLRDRLRATATLLQRLRERQADIARLPQRLLAAAFAPPA